MTTDLQSTSPGETPPSPPAKSFFERIAGVLFAPAETFQDIARKPDILAPLLFIVLMQYLCTAVIIPKLDVSSITAQQAEQMRKQNPNMDEAQLEKMQKIGAASVKVISWIMPVLLIAWYAIVAGALLLAFRLFGGEGGFAQAFSVTLYAWMPLVILGVITAIVVLARGSFDPITAQTLVKSSPAFLVDMKEQPVLFSLVAAFDIFTLWSIALLSIGFSKVAKTTVAKAATVVVSLWLVLILIKVGLAAIGAARMKA